MNGDASYRDLSNYNSKQEMYETTRDFFKYRYRYLSVLHWPFLVVSVLA